MISTFFHAFFYDPIYNTLVALVALVPGSDVGIAVVLLTIIIRIVLLPFSLSAARTQLAMKKLKELKEKYKGNKEKEALETLALYREERVNPFSSILMVFIQIPVLLALYWVFLYEPFTVVNTSRLYPFTPVPDSAMLLFLGLIPVMGKSLILAFLAGVTQYLQAHMALQGTMKTNSGDKGIQADFQRVMGMQLKYVFPFIIAVISYTTSSAIALYFITTNIAGAIQEWHVRRTVLNSDQS